MKQPSPPPIMLDIRTLNKVFFCISFKVIKTTSKVLFNLEGNEYYLGLLNISTVKSKNIDEQNRYARIEITGIYSELEYKGLIDVIKSNIDEISLNLEYAYLSFKTFQIGLRLEDLVYSFDLDEKESLLIQNRFKIHNTDVFSSVIMKVEKPGSDIKFFNKIINNFYYAKN